MNNDPRNIFMNQREEYANGKEREKNEGKTTADSYDDKLKEMKRLAEKYQKAGESQLVKDIIDNVLEQKASGKLTNEQLVTFADRIKPLLSTEQKQRLDELMQELLKL